MPVKQLIAGLKQGYALAVIAGAMKAEVARRAEMLAALRDEYKATLAGLRGRVQAGLRQFAEEHEARYRVEKARMHERLVQIKAEYAQVKERIRELSDELAVLLNVEPSLIAVEAVSPALPPRPPASRRV